MTNLKPWGTMLNQMLMELQKRCPSFQGWRDLDDLGE